MYKIGEFSKLVDLPIRTLRYYDECGILKPDYIDEFSGYRYYTDDNVFDAYVIKVLKDVNFSLEEIALYKDNLDLSVLREKKEELYRDIYMLELKCKKIELMEEELENNGVIFNKESNAKVLRRVNEEEFRKAS